MPLRFFGYFLCVIGCSTHVYMIIYRFFSWNTYFHTVRMRPTMFVPPAVSICFPYHQLMNYSLALTELPKFRDLIDLSGIIAGNDTQLVANLEKGLKNDSFRDEFYHSLHEEYTIPEMIGVLIKLEYFLDECRTLIPGEYSFGNCSAITPFHKYVKDAMICYQFNVDPIGGEDSVYDAVKFITWHHGNAFLFRFKFVHLDPSLKRLLIFVHPRKRRPYGRTDNPVEILLPATRKEYILSYARYFTHLLPNPYKPGCHDYSNAGSRNQEIESCVRHGVKDTSGKVPTWLTVRSDIPVKVLHQSSIAKQEYEALFELVKKCFDIHSKPDCRKEEYMPWLERWKDGNGSVEIKVNLPTSPELINIQKPVRSYVDLFVDINSLLGIWFGVYVAAIFRLRHMAKKFLHTHVEALFLQHKFQADDTKLFESRHYSMREGVKMDNAGLHIHDIYPYKLLDQDKNAKIVKQLHQ